MAELTGRELLKLMAQQAKNRMKGRSHEIIEKKTPNYKMVMGGQRLEYKTTIISKIEDEILYHKVCNLLETEGEVFNPIDKIIDITAYNQLSFCGQQKYLFDLAEKYRTFKERFEIEQLSKTV